MPPKLPKQTELSVDEISNYTQSRSFAERRQQWAMERWSDGAKQTAEHSRLCYCSGLTEYVQVEVVNAAVL
jgi:hypothetical protein